MAPKCIFANFVLKFMEFLWDLLKEYYRGEEWRTWGRDVIGNTTFLGSNLTGRCVGKIFPFKACLLNQYQIPMNFKLLLFIEGAQSAGLNLEMDKGLSNEMPIDRKWLLVNHPTQLNLKKMMVPYESPP